MTYPKVSTTDATAVASSPSFPDVEQHVLDYWEADGTFQATTVLTKCGSRYEAVEEDFQA